MKEVEFLTTLSFYSLFNAYNFFSKILHDKKGDRLEQKCIAKSTLFLVVRVCKSNQKRLEQITQFTSSCVI